MIFRTGDSAKYEGHIFSPDETPPELFSLAIDETPSRIRPTDEFLEKTGLKRQITPDEITQLKSASSEKLRDPDLEWAGLNLHDISAVVESARYETNKENGPASRKEKVTAEMQEARDKRYVPHSVEKLIGAVGERISANIPLSKAVTVAVSNAYREVDDVLRDGQVVPKMQLKAELRNIGNSEFRDVYQEFGTTQKDFILIQTLLTDIIADGDWRERIIVKNGVSENERVATMRALKVYCLDLIEFYSDFDREKQNYIERHNGGAAVPIMAAEYVYLRNNEPPLNKKAKKVITTVLDEVYDMIDRPQKNAAAGVNGSKIYSPELIRSIYEDDRVKTHRLLISGYFESTIPDAIIKSQEDPDKIAAVVEVKAWDVPTIKQWLTDLKASEDEQLSSVKEPQTKYERSGLQVKTLTRNAMGEVESFDTMGPNIRGMKTFANIFNHTNDADIPVVLRFTDEIQNDEIAYLQSLLRPEDGIVIFQRLPISARGPDSVSTLATEFVQDYARRSENAIVNQIVDELKKPESWEL